MATHVLTIGRVRYAAGLFWQSLTLPQEIVREAREIGQRVERDRVVYRRGRALQVGLCKHEELGGQRGATYSIASVLAERLGDDWVGAFELEDEPGQYLLVGVKRGGVIPGCDIVGDAVEVRDTLRAQYAQHVFENVFVSDPDQMQFSGKTLTLHDALGAKRPGKEHALIALAGPGTAPRVIVALLIAAIAAGGMRWKEERDRAREEAQEAQRLEQEAKAARLEHSAAQRQAQTNVLPHPWILQPRPDVFVRACVEAIYAVPLSIGGWVSTSAQCNGVSVVIAVERRGVASITDVRDRAVRAGFSVDAIDTEGNAGTLRVALPTLNPGGDDALEGLDALMERVRSMYQRRNRDITLAPKVVQAPPPQEGEAAPVADWRTQIFTVAGPMTPLLAIDGLLSVPALRVLSVAARRSDATLEWTVTGEINGK